MCWLYGHRWFWVGQNTACRDVFVCPGCGVTQSATSVSTIINSTSSR